VRRHRAFWISPTFATVHGRRGYSRLKRHFDKVLRFTPGQRAVLHFDPDVILAFAGFPRGDSVGIGQCVAEDLLFIFQLVITVLKVTVPGAAGRGCCG